MIFKLELGVKSDTKILIASHREQELLFSESIVVQ